MTARFFRVAVGSCIPGLGERHGFDGPQRTIIEASGNLPQGGLLLVVEIEGNAHARQSKRGNCRLSREDWDDLEVMTGLASGLRVG